MSATRTPISESPWLIAWVVGSSVGALWFAWTWNQGFDLADEGFYWYGSQRILRGELPFRDFMSYDIGRYLLAAGVMQLLGDDGLFVARVAAALAATAATVLAVGLMALSFQQSERRAWRYGLAVLGAAVLTLWIWPCYKAFDHAAAAATVLGGVWLLQSRSPRRWLGAGVIVGAVAVIGRNHGVYAAAACILLLAGSLLHAQGRQQAPARVVALVVGCAIGFLPNIVLMLTAEGFAHAFWQSIVALLELGKTNHERPVPWPWISPAPQVGRVIRASHALLGLGFVSLFVFPVVALLWLRRQQPPLQSPRRQVVAASLAAALPYAHYAFSRPDATHLSVSVVPALVGTCALLAGLRAPALMAAMAGGLLASGMAMGQSQPRLHAAWFGASPVPAAVQGRTYWMYRTTAQRLQIAQELFGSEPAPRFLAVPNLMGLYAVYRVASPTWEIYPLFDRSAAFQAAEIQRLERARPEWILLSDHALDGVNEHRFSQWRPAIHAWIRERYEPVELANPPDPDFAVLRPRPP